MSGRFARTMIHGGVVESTSDLARQLVNEGSAALPMIVRADRQTRGRGRGEHSWWSDAGSITLTIALDPAAHGLRPDHEPRLALATAVALIDAIGPFAPGASLGIRWPNDVEAGGKKLAGLLPERVETAAGVRLLVGIGVNVRTDLGLAPSEVRAMATTVEVLRGGAIGPGDVEAIFAALLAGFGRVVPRLAADDPTLAGRWRALDTLGGTPVRVDLGPRIVAGMAGGIDDRGGLIVRAGGEDLTLFGGQVLRG